MQITIYVDNKPVSTYDNISSVVVEMLPATETPMTSQVRTACCKIDGVTIKQVPLHNGNRVDVHTLTGTVVYDEYEHQAARYFGRADSN